MMEQAIQDSWRAPWTAAAPLSIGYAFVGAETGWQADGDTGAAFRDLALGAASGGAMAAQHRRGRGGDWLAQDVDFRFIYVLQGRLDLAAGGGSHSLRPRSVALFGAGVPAAAIDASADLELIDISALPPAHSRAPGFRTARTRWLDETPESFVTGAGPRRYFAYRDLGTADFTGRRLHIHVVKALQPMPGGTGWHNHTMSQLFVVLTGWADVAVEGRGMRRLGPGDAMCLQAGMRHDVPAYSADYTVLEMCVPADYDTAATDAPRPTA
ncbi:MAG: cupin domain-containing protein [Rhodospirillaceae bacterium]|nr:cupin domain-containing protein [Rhodospirillaceae bacterium]